MSKLNSYFEEFLKNLSAEKDVSTATIKSYRTDFNTFQKFLSVKNIEPEFSTIKTPILKNYVTYLKIECNYSNGTVRRHIHSLSSFFKFLLEMDYIKSNPMLAIHAPKNQQKLPIYLKKEELELLLDAPTKYARFPCHINRDIVFLSLLIFTGARKSEIIALDWKDIDFKNQTVTIRKGKGKKERIIPLAEHLAIALVHYYSERHPKLSDPILISDKNRRISSTDFQQLFQRYIKKCGLDGKGYTPHKCRHSLASLLVQQGVDILVVAKMLGHEDLNSTKIYAHTETDTLRKEIKKFPVK